MDMLPAAREPETVISWKTYRVPLNDVCRLLNIHEPAKSSREVEIANGCLVVTVRSDDSG